MSTRITGNSPAGGVNIELLNEEARFQWGATFKGSGVLDEGGGDEKVVFAFPEGAGVTQSDVDNLLAAHDKSQPSQRELDAQASQSRQATIEAAMADLDDGTASSAQIQEILAALARESKIMG